jgi:hypothetical protein
LRRGERIGEPSGEPAGEADPDRGGMSMQPIHHPRSATPFASSLSAEWDRLAASPAARQALRRWRLPSLATPCADLDDLVAAAGHGRPLDDDEADRVLLELVVLAVDDDLAARVVLQRVLPALVAVASRRAGADRRARERALEELTATAWIVIRTYPVRRRPTRVASNIVRDSEYGTFVRPRRLRSAGEVPGTQLTNEDADEPRRWCGPDGAPASFELVVEVLRSARDAGLCADDLRFVAGLASGWTTERLAAEFGICQRSVRNRRAAVVARIRAMERAAAAA